MDDCKGGGRTVEGGRIGGSNSLSIILSMSAEEREHTPEEEAVECLEEGV